MFCICGGFFFIFVHSNYDSLILTLADYEQASDLSGQWQLQICSLEFCVNVFGN